MGNSVNRVDVPMDLSGGVAHRSSGPWARRWLGAWGLAAPLSLRTGGCRSAHHQRRIWPDGDGEWRLDDGAQRGGYRSGDERKWRQGWIQW
jgi:hypothetical protein